MAKKSVDYKRELAERKKAEKLKDYEQRKSAAISEGNRYLFLVCPLCLRNRPLQTFFKGKTLFRVDPGCEIVQTRYGLGGRGVGGFYKNEPESVRLPDLKSLFPDVYENLREEVLKLYKLFYPKK